MRGVGRVAPWLNNSNKSGTLKTQETKLQLARQEKATIWGKKNGKGSKQCCMLWQHHMMEHSFSHEQERCTWNGDASASLCLGHDCCATLRLLVARLCCALPEAEQPGRDRAAVTPQRTRVSGGPVRGARPQRVERLMTGPAAASCGHPRRSSRQRRGPALRRYRRVSRYGARTARRWRVP